MNKYLRKAQQDYNIIASHFSQKRREIWQEIRPFLKYVKSGDKVLDAGCGNGRMFRVLENKEVRYLGIDFSKELLKLAQKENPRGKFRYGNLTNKNTFKNLRDFDCCLCIAVLHSLPTRELQTRVLKNICESLKKDGILILTVWNLYTKKFIKLYFHEIPWKISKGFKLKWLRVPYKVSAGQKIEREVLRLMYSFTVSELKNLLKDAGFKIIRINVGRNLCFLAKKC